MPFQVFYVDLIDPGAQQLQKLQAGKRQQRMLLKRLKRDDGINIGQIFFRIGIPVIDHLGVFCAKHVELFFRKGIGDKCFHEYTSCCLFRVQYMYPS